MDAYIFRILAAVGAASVVIFIGAAVMVLISWMIEKRQRHDMNLDAKHGFAISQDGKHYIADAPDLEKATEIIKIDEYGMWKTERGLRGPWKLMEGRHD